MSPVIGRSRLASAGLGDYGRLFSGSRVPLAFNSAAPQRGDDRVYVNMSVRF